MLLRLRPLNALLATALLVLRVFVPEYAHSCASMAGEAVGGTGHAMHDAAADFESSGAHGPHRLQGLSAGNASTAEAATPEPADDTDCECASDCCLAPTAVMAASEHGFRSAAVAFAEQLPVASRSALIVERLDVRLPFATAPPVA